MTREKLIELWPIFEGAKEGKQLQRMYTGDASWKDASLAELIIWINNGANHCKWRTKPEPREFWINKYEDGDFHLHLTREQAEANSGPIRTPEIIRVREVI